MIKDRYTYIYTNEMYRKGGGVHTSREQPMVVTIAAVR